MKHPQDEHDLRKSAIEDEMNERAEERASTGTLSFAKYPDCKTWTVFDDERTLASKIPDEATAQRIVTAVNSHAELLNFVLAIARCVKFSESEHPDYCEHLPATVDWWITSARAAIARAEGRAK